MTKYPEESVKINDIFKVTHVTSQEIFEIDLDDTPYYCHLTYVEAKNLIRWLERQMEQTSFAKVSPPVEREIVPLDFKPEEIDHFQEYQDSRE